MYIKELHISSFGPLVDKSFQFADGLNIIEGANESGKSAVATFIKFLFYGLGGRAGDSLSEKQRYVNWNRGQAAGHAVLVATDGDETKTIRVERMLTAKTDENGRVKYSERVKVLDHETSMPIAIEGQPGEFLFGVPEEVFLSSAFASQEGSIKPEAASLREAVENIICAADENVSVKRAVDLIEKARVKLLHKNRTGGEILELERRRDALEAKLYDSKDTSSRLIRSEISLSDVKDNIGLAENRRAELEALEAALETYDLETKIARAAALRRDADEAKAKLDADKEGAENEKFMAALSQAVRDIERAEKKKADLAAKTKALEAMQNKAEKSEKSEKKVGKPAEVCTKVCDKLLGTAGGNASDGTKLISKFETNFRVGMILLAVGLVAILGTTALSFLKPKLTVFALIATIILVLLGVGFTLLSEVSRRRYKKLLAKMGAKDDDELSRLVTAEDDMKAAIENAAHEYEGAKYSAKEAELVIGKLATSAGVKIAGVSIKDLVRSLAKYGSTVAQKRKMMESELSRLEGQLAETEGMLRGVDVKAVRERAAKLRETKLWETAENMTSEERAALSREAAFLRTKAVNLRDREIELERETATLKASGVSPAETAEQLESINTRLAHLTKVHDALRLATETLSTASENIRRSVVPRLTAGASQIMGKVTDGRYTSLGITPAFDMNFRDEEAGTMELDFLSAGTKEAAYIALRLALVKALYDEDERPMLIFDESLASLDADRVAAALEMLDEQGVQVFLFTCRAIEGELAKNATLTHLTRN